MSELPAFMLTTFRNHLLLDMYREYSSIRTWNLSKIIFDAIEKTERELAAIYGPTYKPANWPSEFDWWRSAWAQP